MFMAANSVHDFRGIASRQQWQQCQISCTNPQHELKGRIKIITWCFLQFRVSSDCGAQWSSVVNSLYFKSYRLVLSRRDNCDILYSVLAWRFKTKNKQEIFNTDIHKFCSYYSIHHSNSFATKVITHRLIGEGRVVIGVCTGSRTLQAAKWQRKTLFSQFIDFKGKLFGDFMFGKIYLERVETATTKCRKAFRAFRISEREISIRTVSDIPAVFRKS